MQAGKEPRQWRGAVRVQQMSSEHSRDTAAQTATVAGAVRVQQMSSEHSRDTAAQTPANAKCELQGT
jgi:hypothetical protein